MWLWSHLGGWSQWWAGCLNTYSACSSPQSARCLSVSISTTAAPGRDHCFEGYSSGGEGAQRQTPCGSPSPFDRSSNQAHCTLRSPLPHLFLPLWILFPHVFNPPASQNTILILCLCIFWLALVSWSVIWFCFIALPCFIIGFYSLCVIADGQSHYRTDT